MLQEIMVATKIIQIQTLEILLSLNKILTNNNSENIIETDENCILDTANCNLEREKMIQKMVISIQEVIQGGK